MKVSDLIRMYVDAEKARTAAKDKEEAAETRLDAARDEAFTANLFVEALANALRKALAVAVKTYPASVDELDAAWQTRQTVPTAVVISVTNDGERVSVEYVVPIDD